MGNYGGDHVDQLCRAAAQCRHCFTEMPSLKAALIDRAQPRWMGPQYWKATPRCLLLLLNPGGGAGYPPASNETARSLFRDYAVGSIGLECVFAYQRTHMREWGRPPGRFLQFYVEGLALNLDRVAFANIAWCATHNNYYPNSMLDACFGRHTGPLVRALDPQVVLLSGKGTHRFASHIRHLVPEARVITMLHYAHRKGAKTTQAELKRVRQILADQFGTTNNV